MFGGRCRRREAELVAKDAWRTARKLMDEDRRASEGYNQATSLGWAATTDRRRLELTHCHTRL